VTTFKVVVTPEAQTGIRLAFRFIHERSPGNAARWLQGLYVAIDSLERFPDRCAYAREREYVEEDLRQFVYESHRVVFRVDHPRKTVFVLFFRHAGQRAVGESDDPYEDPNPMGK
jgi:plasmid stabilization system protein ParE